MASSEFRRGYEFPREVRTWAFEKAGGTCEIPGCESPHDGTVDHHMGIFVGRMFGLDRESLKDYSNAQMLCSYHNKAKTDYEAHLARLMREKGFMPVGTMYFRKTVRLRKNGSYRRNYTKG